jgi:outer membrane protein TolC
VALLLHAAQAWSQKLHRYVVAIALAVSGISVHAETLTFQRALSVAVQDTPTLRANAAQVDAARYSVTPAGELPDPKLALGIDNLPIQGQDRYRLNQDFMTMQRIALMQDIPNGAKRDARVAAANARVELAEAQARVMRLTVLRETAVAWIGRNSVEQQLARIDALNEENRLLGGAVRAQIASGKGAATDAVMPRQEAAMIEERRDELMARRSQAVAALRRWIGPAAEVPLAGSPPDWQLLRETLAHKLHQHPELVLFEPRTKVLDAEIAEAKAAKRPDWGVDLAYQKRGPEFGDMVSVQVRFDLPIFSGSRQEPQIAARQAERTALDAERETALREHLAMLESDWADYQRLVNASRRQREILLPLAEEKVHLATAAWRGGKSMLADVIAARRERIDTELKAIALEGERLQMAARLHYAYGDISGEQQ